MIQDPDIQQAEKTVIIQLLTSLKVIIPVLATLLVAVIGAGTNWFQGYSNRPLGAPTTQCSAAQCDSLLVKQFSGATRGVCACCAIYFGTACQHPAPAPSPSPTVVVDAGPPAPSVVFPACNPPTFAAPGSEKIQQYRRTLRPRHKVTGMGMLLDVPSGPVVSVMWPSNDPWCGNQGNLGACEAFTQLDIATSSPRKLSFATQSLFNSAGVAAYKWITANDDIPGQYPPNDTGSDSLSGCKWLVQNGYAKSCQVLSGASAVKVAIQSGPVITGMNWLDGMFTPDRCGNLALTGAVQGGHSESLAGYDAARDLWIIQNHWDNPWGICLGTHCGYHVLTSAQLFGSALDADFVQPVR